MRIDEYCWRLDASMVYSDETRDHNDSMKIRRQGLILELVEREALRSQDAVRRRLKSRGFVATQATISRDIRDLGLVKRSRDGAYQPPGAEVAASPSTLTALERVAADCVRKVDRAGQLVVVRTGAAQAQPLAIAIDRAQLPDAVGTIAGDDTVLIIAKDERRAASLARRLSGYAGR
jgi:transcriptional regulator of arginine metabolism